MRHGVVPPQDFQTIADKCNATSSYVMQAVNGWTVSGERMNEEINRRLQGMPIADPSRRIAYAQKMLDDKLERAANNKEEVTRYDPLDILDYIRKETQTKQPTIDNRKQTVNVFDFSAYSDEKLMEMITKVQQMLDSGEVIEGDFTEVLEIERDTE